MPKWIHDRAKHIREKNPDMPESQSWAIATQQSYAAGKAPKTYGTKQGRKVAKKKYDDPKSSYQKKADPSSKSKTSSADVALMKGFSDELTKISFSIKPAEPTKVVDVKGMVPKAAKSTLTTKPKAMSKPQASSTEAPKDPLSSTRTNPPPPVTAGTF